MTVTVEWIVNNTAYNLGDGTLVWREGDTGLGMAPLHHITERGPQQHGVTFRGVKLDPRVFVLLLGMSGTTQTALYTLRQTLEEIFAPANSETPGIMRWTLDSGAVRQLDCVYSGRLDFNSADRAGFTYRAMAEFVAHDPTFYDPTIVTKTCALPLAGGMVIPLVVPIAIGSTSTTGIISANYAGTWMALPYLKLTGPITDPMIRNVSTDKILNFTGTTIGAGNYYEIDCAYGVKSVKDKNGDYQGGKLIEPSHLSTFAIGSRRDVPNGINTIQVNGSSISAATLLTVQYCTRYVGI
jgi:hypothetical protein